MSPVAAHLPRLFAFATLAVIAVMSPAEAKPKQQLVNGCTTAQMQSEAAAQCIRQTGDDIVNNRATVHRLYCSSSGTMMCCEYDQAGNTVDHSCETLRISRPQLDIRGTTTGTFDPGASLSEPGGGAAPAAAPSEPLELF